MNGSREGALERFAVTCAAGHDGTSVPSTKLDPVGFLADDFAALGCGMVGCRAPIGEFYRDTHDRRTGRRIAREVIA